MLSRFRAHLPSWRRALRRRRRTVALLALALVAAMAAPSLVPPGVQGTAIVVADADLPAGTSLEQQHLRTIRIAVDLAPKGSSTATKDLIGRETVLAIPAGTPIFPGLLDGGGTVVVAPGSSLMALPTPSVLTPHLLPGVEIEILTSNPTKGTAARIPGRVVELPEGGAGDTAVIGSGASGQMHVLVAVGRSRAGELAHAISEGWVTVSIID